MTSLGPVVFCDTEPDHCLPRACDPSHATASFEALQKWIDDRYQIPWGDLQLLAWLAILALPFAAWGLATLVVPKGPMRARRAAISLGPAALLLGGMLVAVRLFSLLPIRRGLFVGDGALSRLLSGASIPVPAPVGGGTCLAPPIAPGEAVLGIATACGLALLALAPWFARREGRREDSFRVPGALPAGALLAMAAACVPLLLVPALDLASFQARMLDWAGALPILCMALAIWTQARREAPPRKEAPPAPPPAEPGVVARDAAAVWRQIGALGPESRAFLAVPAGEGQPASAPLEQAWKAAGGVRHPPNALDAVLRLASTRESGAVVPDLPHTVEDVLLASTIAHATAVGGARCLVLLDDISRATDGSASSPLRDRVRAALAGCGYWEPGPMPLGYEDLSVTLTGNRLPAVAFVGVDELSEKVIAAMWGTTGVANGVAWARHLDLVVVPRLDHGSPLRVAHRFWALRRLCLALRAAGASWSVVTTGYGGDESYALARGAFAGYVSTDRVEVGPRSVDETFAWAVDPAWAAQGPDPWPLRASEPIARAGLSVSVDDPLGYVDEALLRTRAPGVRRSRGLTFEGAASVAPLEGSWLFAAIRALQYRMPSLDSSHHDTLLSYESGPTTRFALDPQTLPSLLAQRRLPAPSPLVARRNPEVQALHLRAAVAEGEQDLRSLHAVFDEAAMVDETCKRLRRKMHALRGSTDQRSFGRVEVLARSGESAPSSLRETVTEKVVRLVELDSGREVGRTDAINAGTRYYPGRVFAEGARRYEVPLDAARRDDVIRVRQVDPGRPLTRSRLAVEFVSVVSEQAADLELRLGGNDPRGNSARLHHATLRVVVQESVHGVVDDGGRIVQRFASVRSAYPSRVQLLAFRRIASSNVLIHLAAAVDDVLRNTIACGREDFAVVPTDGTGLLTPALPGLVVVDRQVHSAGVAEALPPERLLRVLEWVHAILAQCTCADGCDRCTARRVLDAGPDKVGVLALLGG